MIEYNLIFELVGALNEIGKYFRGCPGFPPLSTGNDPNSRSYTWWDKQISHQERQTPHCSPISHLFIFYNCHVVPETGSVFIITLTISSLLLPIVLFIGLMAHKAVPINIQQ